MISFDQQLQENSILFYLLPCAATSSVLTNFDGKIILKSVVSDNGVITT